MSRKSRKYAIGLDVGTSGTKALLVDNYGRVLGHQESPHKIHAPKPTWSEQDPNAWWKAADKAVSQLLSRFARCRSNIVAIGLSGQMHGSVFLDKTGSVLRPAILWNDQRTSRECEEITRLVGGRSALLRYTSNIALPGYTAPKILWVRNNEPKLFDKTRTILLPKDYIAWRLCGEFATDVGDASGTLLFNVRKRKWHKKVLRALDLDPKLFCRAYESVSVVGELHAALARRWSLPAGKVKVVIGSGDQPAAAIGMGVLGEGDASLTLGTSGVVFAASATPADNAAGLLQSFCHAVPDTWCLFGCMLSAGASLEWLRDKVFEGQTVDSLLARASQATSNGLFFLPYLNGERCPYPDPHSRACWVGMQRGHTRADLVRAALEGISFGLKDQLRALKSEGIQIRQLLCAGGGSRNAFWQQLQTDIYGIPTRRLDTPHASALGAALLAGTGAGMWEDISAACKAGVHAGPVTKPRRQRHYKSRYRVYRNLYPTLRPAFEQIHGISAS
ncbi:MAG: xylulokinase [Bdellovibrionales bacterium]|nr:xylulokinase [Bdellovibrionales bacterium]